jgi:NADH-quinone oxidoreductase subunit N
MLSALATSLQGILPEIVLCSTIVVILLSRLSFPRWIYSPHICALLGSIVALVVATAASRTGTSEFFGGMLIGDPFGNYFRWLLLLFFSLFTVLSLISGIPTLAFATEFYVLSLGALLGMCLLTSANHVLLIMVAFEMASLPCYALAGILKGYRKATEAALKFAIFGAGSSGITLFGFSLLAAVFGSVHLPTMSRRLAELLTQFPHTEISLLPLVIGVIFVGAGIAFKLSLVPFHFWIADVFEGATPEVAGFLSVASKLAALAIFLRLVVAFGHPLGIANTEQTVPMPASVALAPRVAQSGVMTKHAEPLAIAALLLGSVAAITCTLGNFAAYPQSNIKKLMAYSTIAHAGYLAMGGTAVVSLLSTSATRAEPALAALMLYSFVYIFMNLGMFAVIAFLRNRLGSEDIAAYRGYVQQEPLVVICVIVFLFNLIGLPPFGGFVAKFAVFATLADAGLWWLLILGVLNTLISLFYYLRIAKVMVFDSPQPEFQTPSTPNRNLEKIMLLGLVVPLLVVGLWWNGLFDFCRAAAREMLQNAMF